MDIPVVTRLGYCIIFEFHSEPLTKAKLLRNFQYLANLRPEIEMPVKLVVICGDFLKRSVKSVKIFPDWDFEPEFKFLIDIDGEEILNSIKTKSSISELDAYKIAILPFTKYAREPEEMVEMLCYLVNELEIDEVKKYIIKLSQLLWVNALIKDEKQKEKLKDVIKMRSTFLHNYEKNLVKQTERNKSISIARRMKKMKFSPQDIYRVTGIRVK